MVPLISSATTGPAGICQLPRYWWKHTLFRHGRLDAEYPHCSNGLDAWVLELGGIDPAEADEYFDEERPDYAAFEAWYRERAGGNLSPGRVAAHNRRIEERVFDRSSEYGLRKIKETYGDIGFDLSEPYESAVILNCMQDWQLFHRRDLPRMARTGMHLPLLISHFDFGTLRLPLLPRTWLKGILPHLKPQLNETEDEILHLLAIPPAILFRFLSEDQPDFVTCERWLRENIRGDLAETGAQITASLEARRGNIAARQFHAWREAWEIIRRG